MPAAAGNNESGGWLQSLLRNLPYFYIGAAALGLIAGVVRPIHLQPFLLMLILRQAAHLGIAVLGQAICIRLLSLDLSFGGVAMAVSYIMTSGIFPVSEIALIGISLLFGVIVGATNAFFITRLRASSVIVTLAMTMILGGVVTAFTQLRAPGDAGEILRYFGQARIGGLPIAVLVWLGLTMCLTLFMRSAVFGRYTEAIGANPQAALASGIPYVRIMFVGHILSSLFAVISSLLLLGILGVGSLSIGSDLALNSLAAVILGGVTFGSGRGGVVGPAVATFMLLFCFNFLTSLGLGEPVKQMAQGAIIAIAAIAYSGNRLRQL